MEGNKPDRYISLLLGAVAGISIGISILDIIGILTGWAARLTPFFVGILLLYVVLERERVDSIKYIVRRLDKGIDRVNAAITRLQGGRRTTGSKSAGMTAAYREIPFKGMIFRSKTEVRIARALEHAGIVYLPPTKARLNTSTGRQGREIDFLIFDSGRWGMLEVDGPWHSPGSDAQRDAMMRANGLTHIQRFDADRCYRNPDAVVAEFMAALRSQQPAPQSPPVQ
ncbi:MAG: hypothetical protein KME04_16685 [Pleurocapsa minor GSE-CHR-MK-17-07R]|jgi:hypothetical protein|nr:hypothetical protein [Pleurocapsa minor GSE-CHR-MK 17-07R]